MSPTFTIKRITSAFVIANDKTLFNSNNHGTTQPADYNEASDKTMTRNWIEKFHSAYSTLRISKPSTLAWMKEAAVVGSHTGRPSTLFTEEIADLATELSTDFDKAVDAVSDERNNKMFIRTDHVSLKYSVHGVGPFTKGDCKRVIEGLVTSSPGHTCIRKDDKECVLYVFPWIHEFQGDLEFRVFVYRNRVTAVSQQHLYKVNQTLKDKTDAELQTEVLGPLMEYFEGTVLDSMTEFGNYTVDFALVPVHQSVDQSVDGGKIKYRPYFIEMNGFGAEYAAGSALFHWIIDENVLLGDGSTVELRLTIE